MDVHTHFMPDNVLRKVWAYFEALGEGVWPITYRFSQEERVATLRDFGVLRFSALSYPHRPDMAAWLNGWAAEFARRNPDSLRSATFYPEPEAKDYVAEAIGSGTRIFKAHLQVGAYDPRDPLLTDVWEPSPTPGPRWSCTAPPGRSPGTSPAPNPSPGCSASTRS